MINFKYIALVFALSGLAALPLRAQPDSLAPLFDVSALVYLDSVTVEASRTGFDVQEFVDLLRRDESFYQAFRNLRFASYEAENRVVFFDKKLREKASYKSRIAQTAWDSCRSMVVLEEESTGKYFDADGSPRYYTAKLYEELFFTKGVVCKKADGSSTKPPSRLDGHINDLKRLMFQPGEEVSVPFIGGRMAIFDAQQQRYYDYSVTSEEYEDGTPCYVFRVRVKPEYEERKEKRTVIKHMETYIAKADEQVLARRYHLRYGGLWFDFDVRMDIKLTRIDGRYYPSYLRYDGLWDVPMKKPETSVFTARFFFL